MWNAILCFFSCGPFSIYLRDYFLGFWMFTNSSCFFFFWDLYFLNFVFCISSWWGLSDKCPYWVSGYRAPGHQSAQTFLYSEKGRNLDFWHWHCLPAKENSKSRYVSPLIYILYIIIIIILIIMITSKQLVWLPGSCDTSPTSAYSADSVLDNGSIWEETNNEEKKENLKYFS